MKFLVWGVYGLGEYTPAIVLPGSDPEEYGLAKFWNPEVHFVVEAETKQEAAIIAWRNYHALRASKSQGTKGN